MQPGGGLLGSGGNSLDQEQCLPMGKGRGDSVASAPELHVYVDCAVHVHRVSQEVILESDGQEESKGKCWVWMERR